MGEVEKVINNIKKHAKAKKWKVDVNKKEFVVVSKIYNVPHSIDPVTMSFGFGVWEKIPFSRKFNLTFSGGYSYESDVYQTEYPVIRKQNYSIENVKEFERKAKKALNNMLSKVKNKIGTETY